MLILSANGNEGFHNMSIVKTVNGQPSNRITVTADLQTTQTVVIEGSVDFLQIDPDGTVPAPEFTGMIRVGSPDVATAQ